MHIARSRPTYLATLSRFVAEARPGDLPQEALARTRWVLADSIAVIGAGAQERETGALAERMAATAPGLVPMIGTGLSAGLPTAAFLNGTAGTFLELDEGNQFCRGHPGIHVVPAVLAEALALGASGADVLLAIALAYEVGARIGIAQVSARVGAKVGG